MTKPETPESPSGSITDEQALAAFLEHLRDKANEARLKYGLLIDAEVILRMLDDRAVVRYPTTLEFTAGPLQPHEFAYPQALGFHPSDGYVLCVHPHFERMVDIWPLLIAYHIPVINYGEIADEQAAETYGAALNGLEVEAYYQALCELTDSMPPE